MADDEQKNLKNARANLARVASQSKDETPAYTEANNAVIKAEKALPWWKR
jgi:hypothetical protein